MNEPNELNPTQLAAATSRDLPSAAPLDSETAALREVWLSLGRAVDAENAGFREDALLERLADSSRLTTPATKVMPAARQSQPSSLWPMLLGTALALAMLIAVVRTMNLAPERGGLAVQLSPAVPSPLDSPVDPPMIVQESESPVIAAWSDPLDDEIDSAFTQLRAATSRSGGVDDSLTALQTQLQQLSADLVDGSL